MRQTNSFKLIILFFTVFFYSKSSNAQVFTEATNFPVENLSYSTTDWGDYDNDGDLDLLIAGRESFQKYITKIYTNDGSGNFTELTSAQLPGVYLGTVNWGDFNNDNLLDIFITGNIDGNESLISKIYLNEGNGTFTESTQSVFKEVNISSVDLGDYDNDGDLDIILSGNYGNEVTTKIYRNNGDMTFTELTSANIIGVFAGQVSWGDYDNDGDLDILVTGRNVNEPYVTKIYTNNGNQTFTELTGLPFTKVGWSSSIWGDYDNDGYLDVLISGYSPGGVGRNTKLYKNNGDGSFTQSSNQFVGFSEGSVAFGDYNNDGKLDILYSGNIGTAPPISKIYTNNSNNVFTELVGNSIINTKFGSVSWVDVDNDNDLDFIISGHVTDTQAATKLYINNTTTPNTPPNPVTNLSAIKNNNEIVFTWDKATDNNQVEGLSYNLYLKMVGFASYTRSPNSLLISGTNNGKRTIQHIGDIQGKSNANGTISYTLKNTNLVGGSSYEWSVQAVDASLSGGEFTSPQVLTTFDYVKDSESINVYPIPTNDEISVKTKSMIDSVELFNLRGQSLHVFKESFNKLDVSFLPKGIYFLRIKTTNKVKAIKFQKM